MLVHPWVGTALILILQPPAQARTTLPKAFLITPKAMLLFLPPKFTGIRSNGATGACQDITLLSGCWMEVLWAAVCGQQIG